MPICTYGSIYKSSKLSLVELIMYEDVINCVKQHPCGCHFKEGLREKFSYYVFPCVSIKYMYLSRLMFLKLCKTMSFVVGIMESNKNVTPC